MNRVIFRYYKLDALLAAKKPGLHWARDRRRMDGKWGKEFSVAPLSVMHASLSESVDQKPCMYEIIAYKQPVNMYLDIEVDEKATFKLEDVKTAITERGWAPDGSVECDTLARTYKNAMAATITNDECVYMASWLRTAIKRHISLVFPAIGGTLEDNDIVVLSACRSGKMSFHIVCQKVVFTESGVSALAYAFELGMWLRNKAFEAYKRATDAAHTSNTIHAAIAARALLRFMCLDDVDVIDLSVYSKRRQFRLIGNAKNGKAPLCHAFSTETGRVEPVLMTEQRFLNGSWQYRDIVPTVADLKKTLVSVTPLFLSPFINLLIGL